jgi:hypothetical protein
MNTDEKELTYHSEPIDLPSKGLFYSEDSPLRSGQIEVKYMTAKEEDILTSSNLIRKGIVLDKLMDSLIATKGVRSQDLLVGDLNALMVAARILGYGKDYKVSFSCPACSKEVTQVVDLTTLNTANEPSESGDRNITIVLPVSKAEVVLKLLTRADELAIEKELESLKKANLGVEGETTARLRAMIQSVNGDSSKTVIWSFVENMLVRDSRYLREQYRVYNPDVDFNIEVECDCDTSTDKTARLPIGTDFFWPDARI